METEASDSHALLGQMIVTLPYQLLGTFIVIQKRSPTLDQQQHQQPSDKAVSISGDAHQRFLKIEQKSTSSEHTPHPPSPCHSSEERYSETRELLEPELMVLKEIV